MATSRQLLQFTLLIALFAIVSATRSFQDEQELTRAVDIYLEDDGRREEILQTYGPISNWDVSRITNFASLFNKQRNPKAEFFQADLSRWDMSNARYLHDMFLGAAAFDSDLSGWSVGRVLHFNGLFFGAANFTGHGLDLWDVSSGRLFMSMFSSTASLREDLDIRNWNVGRAENMIAMFRDSNFGENMATNNLCGWATKLRDGVQTRAMFMRSGCPRTSDPQLEDRETSAIDFCVRCTPQAQPYPNILFLMTDQQRFDTILRVQEELGRYDNATKIRTPNLDRLSRQGAYFRKAYCQCSVCAPARTSLRTGCTVERTGIQHNELTHEYKNSPLFTERVEKLEGLDQILTRIGYVSEYYGKWHLPDTLYRTDDSPSGGIRFNDYSYDSGQFSFRTDSWGRKLRRYLNHFERAGEISKTIPDEPGIQRDTYTGYPYTPIQIDSRFGYPSGTTLSTQNGFRGFETTQPNVCGPYKLSEDFTPSHFNGDIALKALRRLRADDQPFFLTVSFHNPHPPMVPAWKHLDYYWENRETLFVSPSIKDKLENADYGQVARSLPKYADETVVREWTAVYYALIEEIDEYIGALLDELGDATDNTLIIFTSDHGEMLGAHGKREKNNFFEESARVPLFFAFPDVIKSDTVVDEPVSHLDVLATILDYVGASSQDQSDGKSLRPLIEKQIYNEAYEENFVVAEWDYRKPLLSNHNVLDRRMDERPSLCVVKGSFKLMTQKLASSNKIDMMYDLKSDPFEMNNLLGANAAQATAATIGKAEHLRCLLIDWMERLDGTEKYYSDPLANYGEGEGDIEELRKRQSWPALDFWIGDEAIEIGRLALAENNRMIRSEFLYMGTRVVGAEAVVSIGISGRDAGLFSVDQNEIFMEARQCRSVKITFSATTEMFLSRRRALEAFIVVSREGYPQTFIPLSVQEQDTSEIQLLSVPSPAPSSMPTKSPTESPTSRPSAVPSRSPTDVPTTTPTSIPTEFPSSLPSKSPSSAPSPEPSPGPSSLFESTPHVSLSRSRGGPSGAPSERPSSLLDSALQFSHSRSDGGPSEQPSEQPSIPTPDDFSAFFSLSHSKSHRAGNAKKASSSSPSQVPADQSETPSKRPSQGGTEKPTILPTVGF